MNSNYKKYMKVIAPIWAACFAVLVLVYMLIFSPQIKTKSQITKQIVEKHLSYESALLATHEDQRARLADEIENLRQKLNTFVTDFENSADLTFDVSQIAAEGQVGSFSIKAAEQRRAVELAGCERIAEDYINIGFTGTFEQFATLVNNLERHHPVIFVDKFLINRSAEDDSQHPANLSLTVFVTRPKES